MLPASVLLDTARFKPDLVCAELRRVQKELKEIERDKASGVTVHVNDSNLQKLTGFVPGPKDTP